MVIVNLLQPEDEWRFSKAGGDTVPAVGGGPGEDETEWGEASGLLDCYQLISSGQSNGVRIVVDPQHFGSAYQTPV